MGIAWCIAEKLCKRDEEPFGIFATPLLTWFYDSNKKDSRILPASICTGGVTNDSAQVMRP